MAVQPYYTRQIINASYLGVGKTWKYRQKSETLKYFVVVGRGRFAIAVQFEQVDGHQACRWLIKSRVNFIPNLFL